MKQLEEIPHYICNPEDKNVVAYIDTDSVYVDAEPILKHLNPNFIDLDDKEKDDFLEKIALKYQDLITSHYDVLAKECFNIPEIIGEKKHNHVLEMKTEAVIRAAYFRATRRYAQWITKKEGIVKEELDIKGLEFMKANFPPIFGKFFFNLVEEILKGLPQEDALNKIKFFRNQILKGEIPLTKLGNPTSVKKIHDYEGTKVRSGEIFSTIKKGAPAPVRAAIKYNDLLRLWRLDGKYNYITSSDKVKWIYMKDNPYKIEALAFLDWGIPEKINDFLEKYADRDKIFETILLNKLEGFFSDLGFELNLNPYLNKFKTIEI